MRLEPGTASASSSTFVFHTDTMRISAITSSQFWAAATRSLTKIGTSLDTGSVANTTLAIGTTLDLRPAAGLIRILSISFNTADANGAQLGMWDGSTKVIGIKSGAASSGNMQMIHGTSAAGPYLQNVGGVSACSYCYRVDDLTA